MLYRVVLGVFLEVLVVEILANIIKLNKKEKLTALAIEEVLRRILLK